MVSALHSLFILIYMELIIGILGNEFITLLNFMDWVKMQKISLAHQILTALAISRICLILMLMVSYFTKEFYPSLYMTTKKVTIIDTAATLANHFSTWLATSLSLFYCLKIASFSNPLFLHLKHRVKRVILVIFLGSFMFLPFYFIAITKCVNIQIYPHKGNMTLASIWNDNEKFSKLISFTLGVLIPFSLTLNCFFLLIFSLRKHVKNMKLNATGFRDHSTRVHIRAMKFVVLFLLLFIIYFLSVIIITFNTIKIQRKVMLMLLRAFAALYPSGHTLILILGNGKLRKSFLLVLWRLRCR
jgi:taste receptor type 2|nr:taste receptor type 2 member 140-like [Castor canadensis]